MPVNPKQASLLRKVKSAPVNLGGQLTVDLDKGYDINSVIVRVHGTIDVSVGAATSVADFGMANVLSRVEMFADGRRTYEESNGKLLAFANFERKGKRQISDPDTPVATYNVSVTFYLDRATMDSMRPKDSALHTTLPYMSLLQLRMQFGAISDIMTAGAATLTDDLTVDVYQEETEEFNPKDATEGRMVRVVSLQEIDIDSTNSNLRVKLPVGNFLRGVKMIAVDDSGNAVDNVINNVKLARGTDVRMDVPFAFLREQNANDYDIPNAEQKAGVAYADLCREGRLNKLYDLRSASQADLVLDVTKPAGGNGKVYLAVVEYFEQAPAS